MPNLPAWKPRELEILKLLAKGLTNTEIGARIHLSHETIRWYNKKIFEKLGVRNRTEAVKRAAALGLIGGGKKPERSPVRYGRNGDTHLAYQTIGSGPIDLLFIHGFISHLDLAWDNHEFTEFFERLGEFCRVILFDKRGVGLSDRGQGAPTLEETIADANCVLDAVASKRTFVMGTSEGAAAAVLLASSHPDRVAGLVLYGATPKVVRSGASPHWAATEEQFDAMLARMQDTWGGPWALESFAPSRARDESFRTWWAKVLKSASSPSSIRDVLNLVRKVDICQLLPQIRVRTLVIHKNQDRLVNPDAGRYFAQHMPNAQWLDLPGKDHIYFVDSEGIVNAVRNFLEENPAGDVADTRISIIICAKVQTAIPQKAIQNVLLAQQSRFISLTGDEIIATFDSPTRAVQCAKAILSKAADKNIKISLHVGECFTANSQPLDYVAEQSRKALEYASNGEILLTQTLHDILAGSRLSLQQRSDTVETIVPNSMVLYTLI
jgi:pimeloyl-ACP methyl ester carboxylesterase/DNA-binding CsgD family transcriptional regulator